MSNFMNLKDQVTRAFSEDRAHRYATAMAEEVRGKLDWIMETCRYQSSQEDMWRH